MRRIKRKSNSTICAVQYSTVESEDPVYCISDGPRNEQDRCCIADKELDATNCIFEFLGEEELPHNFAELLSEIVRNSVVLRFFGRMSCFR